VAQRSNWLLAVPQPLSNLASLLQELNRWEWVAANTLELNGDKYAREEVSRQKAAARAQLEKRIQDFVGLQQLGGQMMLDWFRGGRRLKIRNGRQLLETLSEVFEQTYPDAPQVQNELVNRRALSSAAAAARMRLIERMFAYANMPLLGMDASKKPPEMSMYLSVLRKTGLHREDEQGWHIGPPEEGADPCNVLPALRKVNALVHEKPDARVNVVTLFRELRGSTYGVRDGLIPILLSAYAIAHARDVAFYKDGSFLSWTASKCSFSPKHRSDSRFSTAGLKAFVRSCSPECSRSWRFGHPEPEMSNCSTLCAAFVSSWRGFRRMPGRRNVCLRLLSRYGMPFWVQGNQRGSCSRNCRSPVGSIRLRRTALTPCRSRAS
jgi:hypothetical protein